MAVLNVFDPSAYSLQELTLAMNNVPYTPTQITELGLFQEEGIATLSALIEAENGVLSIVAVAPRNGPGQVVDADKRTVKDFSLPHLPQRGAVMADQVQGVRAFGSENMAQTLLNVRNKRLQKMRQQIDYTMEYHRLTAILGNYINVNGTMVSLFTEFGVTEQTVDFVLGTATTKLDQKCLEVLEHIEAGLGGIPFSGAHAYCGSSFWNKLIAHAYIRETHLSTQTAANLRGDPRQIVDYGGIRWERYRGTGSVVIPTGEARVFPTGVDELFITRFGPANYEETVNTMGLPYYAKAERMKFDKGMELEAQSNPLNLCTRPASIVKIMTSN